MPHPPPHPLPLCRILAAVLLYCLAPAVDAAYSWNFPPPVTPLAHETLAVHNEFMMIIGGLFGSVFLVMLYSMLRHRRANGHRPAGFSGPHGALQWLWVSLPFALLMFIDFALMGVPAVRAVLAMQDTQRRAELLLKVTGMQWKWQYEYPEAGLRFTSTLSTPAQQISNGQTKGENYLLEVDQPVVLPVGKKIRILLTSTDVIHTWWVPQFGVKRDAIPGFLRETWVTIDQPGIYRGQCAELCGKGHGFMPVVVEAVPEAAYERWVKQQKAAQLAAASGSARQWAMDELLARGKAVYEKQCATCHQPDGRGLPPAFPPLAGSRVVNTPLPPSGARPPRDSHVDRVLNGKPNTAMQAFRNSLSEVELAAVITYERNSFGNHAGDAIQPAQIRAILQETS